MHCSVGQTEIKIKGQVENKTRHGQKTDYSHPRRAGGYEKFKCKAGVPIQLEKYRNQGLNLYID